MRVKRQLTLDDEEGSLSKLIKVGDAPTSGNPSTLQIDGIPFILINDENMSNREATPALIEGMIPRRGLALIYGEPGIGKSFLMLDMALSVATGIQWFDHPVEQGPVIYVAAEGESGLPARINAWRTAHAVIGPTDIHFLASPVNLTNQIEVNQLLDLVKRLPQRPCLVIFDTLARSMAGADENSPRDMGLAIAAADRIRREIQAAVTFVHHPTKAGGRNAIERGSGQLRGAVDMIGKLTKEANRLALHSEKAKDYPPFPPLYFSLRESEQSRVVFPKHSSQNESSSRLTKQQQAVLDVLWSINAEVSSGEWKAGCDRAGVPGSTFYNASERLVTAGYVTKRADEKGGVWYVAIARDHNVTETDSNGAPNELQLNQVHHSNPPSPL